MKELTGPFKRLATILWLVVPATLLAQESFPEKAGTPTLNGLKLEFDIGRAALTKPLEELDDLYRAQLEKLAEEMKVRGALDELIAVRAEIERLEGKNTTGTGKDFPDLEKVRTIYEKAKVDRTRAMNTALLPEVTRHKESLEHLRAGQTRQNLLEEAIRTHEEIARVQALEEEVRKILASSNGGMVSSLAVPSPAKDLKVKVQVDGLTHFHIRDGKVWFDHSRGGAAPPGLHQGNYPTYLNDSVKWSPVWKGKITDPHDIGFTFPAGEEIKLRIRVSSGRGQATVIQQPLPGNQNTAIVELRDANKEGRGFNGSDWIEFRITW